jgi:hypothetical protein
MADDILEPLPELLTIEQAAKRLGEKFGQQVSHDIETDHVLSVGAAGGLKLYVLTSPDSVPVDWQEFKASKPDIRAIANLKEYLRVSRDSLLAFEFACDEKNQPPPLSVQEIFDYAQYSRLLGIRDSLNELAPPQAEKASGESPEAPEFRLNIQRERDGWAPAIRAVAELLFGELGQLPTQGQVWQRLCGAPPRGYSIRLEGGLLTLPGSAPMSRADLSKRWRKYTSQKASKSP